LLNCRFGLCLKGRRKEKKKQRDKTPSVFNITKKRRKMEKEKKGFA
jgi:hypothetical protein